MGFFKRRQQVAQQRQQLQAERIKRVRDRNIAAAAKATQGPELDPFRGDEELRHAVASLKTGSFGDAEALLAARPQDAWTVAGLSTDKIPLDVYAQWAEAVPSAATQSVFARALIDHAWAKRGTGYASSVDSDVWGSFNTMLASSDAYLVDALQLDPGYVPALVGRLTTAMATSAGPVEIRQRFDALHQVAPFHPMGTWTMVQALAPKWGGDQASMVEFARWVTEWAPEGSPAHVAILDAHFEASLVRAHNGDGNLLVLMCAADISDDIDAAFAKFLAGYDESTLVPPAAVSALNHFIFWSGQTTPEQSANQLKGWRILGDRPTEQPWAIVAKGANIVTTFQNQRQRRLDLLEAKNQFMDDMMASIKQKIASGEIKTELGAEETLRRLDENRTPTS